MYSIRYWDNYISSDQSIVDEYIINVLKKLRGKLYLITSVTVEEYSDEEVSLPPEAWVSI